MSGSQSVDLEGKMLEWRREIGRVFTELEQYEYKGDNTIRVDVLPVLDSLHADIGNTWNKIKENGIKE